MEFTTTNSKNDTIVISMNTFIELYGEPPIITGHQLYLDGSAVRLIEIDEIMGECYLISQYGTDFEELYY